MYFHCTSLSWTGLLHSTGSRESFWCESFLWDLYIVANCWKKKKKKGIIFVYACALKFCKAQAWQAPNAEFTQILVSRSAESCAFPVNCELVLSANAFWTVSCTVNRQGWNSYLCLCRVITKGKVSNCGYHIVIGAFSKDDASCHSVLFSDFWAAAHGQWHERLNGKESLCLTLQPKGDDKSAEWAQSCAPACAENEREYCTGHLSKLPQSSFEKTAQNKWHLEASRDHFLCRPLVITFLTEAVLFWHNILMSEAGITSHCQLRCQCLLYGWNQETVIPDSTSLPRGP